MSIYQLSIYCVAMAVVLLLSGCARPVEPMESAPAAEIETLWETMATSPEIPAEKVAVQDFVEAFAALYFAKDREGMQAYLSADYGSLIDVSPYEEENITVHSCKLPQSVVYELADKGSCWASVEFWESPESDSYTYLSITLVVEDDQWKVQSYGLEK